MADYPTTIDSLTNPATTNAPNSPSHAEQHSTANDILEALEAKVGVDSSAVATSHDYKLSGVTGTDKAVSKTGTETLTNKTLTTPTLTTPTITNKSATGTDSGAETLVNKTLTAPTIASLTNMQHDHSTAAKGGAVPEASVTFSATGHDHTGTTKGNLIPTTGIEDAAVTLAKIASEAWTTYTPTWAVAGQSPTIGTGTLTGAYIKIGRTVIFRIKFTWGNTTAAGGAGVWSFTTPTTINTDYDDQNNNVGWTSMLDSGTASYHGNIRLDQPNLIYPVVGNVAGTYLVTTNLQNTIPHTWATSDVLFIKGIYESVT